ncbi:MAG: nucleoside deaminase [Defluviitaleaceae bacterium]|nr:nucleoside deaminase [Defluviitaleaceae bacterium]
MWNKIETPWKAAFELGWGSLKQGSIPIGAVITDEAGNIISQGRNRIYESSAKNPKIAHAEMEAIQNLDITKHPKLKEYSLFTCMEPCPMCMGTIVMANIRKLRIAAKDSYCGATYFCKSDPYMASKNTDIIFENGLLETVQITLQAYFELQKTNGEANQIVSIFEKDNPIATKIAKSFYHGSYIKAAIDTATPFGEIFNEIAKQSHKHYTGCIL